MKVIPLNRSMILISMLVWAFGCAKTEHTAGPSAASSRPAVAARTLEKTEATPTPTPELTPEPTATPESTPQATPALPVALPTGTPEAALIPSVPLPPRPAATPRAYTDEDLVSLTEIDPTIVVDIQLAHPENIFNYQFFKENAAYVRYATARKIAAVQRHLLKEGLRLKIWSAYRPMPVQIKMYDIVGRNGDWVSDPYDEKSKKAHVRGVAIDCTLVDEAGNELEMPTSYLDFKNAKKMMADYMDLPARVIANRAKLRNAMLDQGMSPYSKEWWHFQDNQIMKYPAIKMSDFPELHERMLVDEMVKLGNDYEAGLARKAAARAQKAAASKSIPKTAPKAASKTAPRTQ